MCPDCKKYKSSINLHDTLFHCICQNSHRNLGISCTTPYLCTSSLMQLHYPRNFPPLQGEHTAFPKKFDRSAQNIICLSTPYHFKFFESCLPQILLGPFLNTLTQLWLGRSCQYDIISFQGGTLSLIGISYLHHSSGDRCCGLHCCIYYHFRSDTK